MIVHQNSPTAYPPYWIKNELHVDAEHVQPIMFTIR